MGSEGLTDVVAAAADLAARRPHDLADDDAPPLVAALALGLAHEVQQAPAARRRRGAHFTPYDVARRLVERALDGTTPVPGAFTACDPACGGGVFLLAVAEALVARGWARIDAARAVRGADVDAATVEVARAALARWAGPGAGDLAAQVQQADMLVDDPWPGHRFSLVAGNPPFLSQLLAGTTRQGATRAAAPALGAERAPYADTSALFLTRSLDLVHDGGRVVLLQPQSVLVARDARVVRAQVLAQARFLALWWADEPIFAAHVRVCAPVLERVAAPTPAPSPPAVTAVLHGREVVECSVHPTPAPGAPWGALVRDLLGVPAVQLSLGRTLADVATATAGFRDEYYGLVGAVREARDRAEADEPDILRLVTCGLVDVLGCSWGRRRARFARVAYAAPVVEAAALAGRVAGWARAQRVPKLLVATQTKVLEVTVDERGDLLPCTPVIAVHAPPELLWPLAAALSAPCISAHALAHVAGAARSAQAIKLAARQVLELPLPVDDAAWREGTALAQRAATATGAARSEALDRLGVVMDRAYGVDDPAVAAWWAARRGDQP